MSAILNVTSCENSFGPGASTDSIGFSLTNKLFKLCHTFVQEYIVGVLEIQKEVGDTYDGNAPIGRMLSHELNKLSSMCKCVRDNKLVSVGPPSDVIPLELHKRD